MRWKFLLVLSLLVVLACLARDLRRDGALPPSTPPGWLEPYDRRSYGGWIDADHDCQDTRQEVLIAESLVRVQFAHGKRCKVARGRWRCPYTGRLFEDPHQLDIDHLVPLRNAHEHGARSWPRARRRAYANELRHGDHLLAVSAHENRAKGAQGPEAWRPPDPRAWCWYAAAWQGVKRRWHLDLGAAEQEALRSMSLGCSQASRPVGSH